MDINIYFFTSLAFIKICNFSIIPLDTWPLWIPPFELNRPPLYKYSQLSTNGHSHKWTALLTDAFSNPHFTSQSNSVFTHSHKRSLSRKWTRMLLKKRIVYFFCLCFPISGQLCIIINSWQWNLSLTKIHCSLTEQQNVGIGFVKTPFVCWNLLFLTTQ